MAEKKKKEKEKPKEIKRETKIKLSFYAPTFVLKPRHMQS